jgi:hypothetical protein
VAVLAVWSELVSAENSLVTGKRTGNFFDLQGTLISGREKMQADPAGCGEIPYKTEQGNNFLQQGIRATDQGSELSNRKRPFLAHLWRGIAVAICSRRQFCR